MAAHPIVHVEIPAHDPEAAGAFYGQVFGWQLHSDAELDYHMFQAEGGPGGGFVRAADGTPTGEPDDYRIGEVLVYIGSDDIDADLARVEAHGGKILTPRTEIPQNGWFGIFTDPSGNKVALYKDLPRQN